MSLSSSLVSVVIYSIPDLNKISSFSVHKVNNKPVKIGRKLFIDKGKIILCFEGKVNIGDIKTGQIEKSFSIHDIVLDMTLINWMMAIFFLFFPIVVSAIGNLMELLFLKPKEKGQKIKLFIVQAIIKELFLSMLILANHQQKFSNLWMKLNNKENN